MSAALEKTKSPKKKKKSSDSSLVAQQVAVTAVAQVAATVHI